MSKQIPTYCIANDGDPLLKLHRRRGPEFCHRRSTKHGHCALHQWPAHHGLLNRPTALHWLHQDRLRKFHQLSNHPGLLYGNWFQRGNHGDGLRIDLHSGLRHFRYLGIGITAYLGIRSRQRFPVPRVFCPCKLWLSLSRSIQTDDRRQVNTKRLIPVRAIILMTFVAMLLGLVNIGSSTAFNALTSLALIGHYTSYLLPIALLVVRRFGTKEIPFGPFTLGKWGLPINLFTIAYSGLLIVTMVFPPYQPLTAENMNYSSLIFGSVLLSSFVL